MFALWASLACSARHHFKLVDWPTNANRCKLILRKAILRDASKVSFSKLKNLWFKEMVKKSPLAKIYSPFEA